MGVPIDRPPSVRVPSEVLMRELGDEAVLLHLGTETYFGLDAVGIQFWRALTEQSSLEDATEALLDLFEVETEELRRDLFALVDELVGHDLLRPAPD